jgi:hypothetical protein
VAIGRRLPSRLVIICRLSMKASAVSREKKISISAETRKAVKGARRAFISTLDSPLRPTELKWERSETKFSEASFPRGLSFSFFFQIACVVALTRARL